MSDMSEILTPALRQYRHNDGSNGFVAAFAYNETIATVEKLESMISELQAVVDEAYRILGKVVPSDQNIMIEWAVKSKDSVYTNAGTAYRVLKPHASTGE